MSAEAPALDPALLAWTARIAEISAGLPELSSSDPAPRRNAARQLSDELATEFALDVPAGITIDEIVLAGDDGRELRLRRFRRSRDTGALPSMLWCHGGGFVGGTIDEILNDRSCAALTMLSGVQIFSLEYRLAPEHPFPAGADDAVSAFRTLRDRAGEFTIALDRFGIGGNSAGATLATTAAHRLTRADVPVHHQALEVPAAALRAVGPSATLYSDGFGLDEAEQLAELYLAGHPLSEGSPLDFPELDGMPPTLMMVAEFDPLRDGALSYADRLDEAGVHVTVHVGPGHVHGSPGLTARWQGARHWRDTYARELVNAYRG